MNNFIRTLSVSIACGLAAISAQAGVCDYRPSQLVGGGGAAALSTGAAATAAAGVGAKAAGFYTLVHAGTGATMLGSTAGGASAAGTVGIMGGTAGFLGTAAAAVMSPAVIVGTAIAAAGVGAYEGSCYWADERITDYDLVLALMQKLSLRADPDYFVLQEGSPSTQDAVVRIRQADAMESYRVENLYVVNDLLMHRDCFRNTTIGHIHFVTLAKK